MKWKRYNESRLNDLEKAFSRGADSKGYRVGYNIELKNRTVGGLINFLKQFNPSLEVVLNEDGDGMIRFAETDSEMNRLILS